jgi:hypothetical protein
MSLQVEPEQEAGKMSEAVSLVNPESIYDPIINSVQALNETINMTAHQMSAQIDGIYQMILILSSFLILMSLITYVKFRRNYRRN